MQLNNNANNNINNHNRGCESIRVRGRNNRIIDSTIFSFDSLLFDVGDMTKLQAKDIFVANSVSKINMEPEKIPARHRVLSNTMVTTETTSFANKEISEYPSVSFQSSVEPNVVEKICTLDFSNEKPRLSSIACSEMP